MELDTRVQHGQLKDYFLVKKGSNGKVLKPQTKKGIFEVAKYITEEFDCLALGDFKRDIFIYKDGVYQKATNFIKEYVQGILEDIYCNGFYSEIIEQVKNRCTKDREEIDVQNKDLINMENGILNIETLEMMDHQPDKYYFFNKIPVIFDGETDCPEVSKFMAIVLSPTNINLVQEMFGFCLYRQYFIKKAFILSGEKNTSKTTLIKLLSNMLGSPNISGVSLQELGNRHFALADLYNKYANIYDDMSADDITSTGKFKMVTGQSPIFGEYKYGERFPFVNYAKLIFICNKIPAVNDIDDDAYFDRWVLINFKNVITKENIDPFLVEKLCTPTEISGLFNFALTGLKRLIRQKWFSYDKSSDEIKQEMLQNSNPIANFVYNCLSPAHQDDFVHVRKDIMYQAYCDFCAKKGLGRDTDDKFYKDIFKYAPYLRNYRSNEVGRPHCYSGARIIQQND